MSDWQIPLSDLDYGPEERQAALRVLESKWLTMGPEVGAFEREFAQYVGAKHAFAVSNATAALHMACVAVGVGPGTEAIQPGINFVAAANMTVAAGAAPVFVEILSLDEPTIDPQAVEAAITPRTKAIIAMHYGGYLCRMAELDDICRSRGIALIEDACHAVGASYRGGGRLNGRKVGALADIACFSFFGNKNLSTGEGGMLTTDRDDIVERLRLLRSHGMTTLTWDRHKGHAASYDVALSGYNYRLDEIHAALGREQLKKLDRNNGRRGMLAGVYRDAFKKIAGWSLCFSSYNGDSAFHLMVAVAPDADARTRAADALRAAQIQSSMHYPCVADFSGFSQSRGAKLDRCRDFARRAITLPLYPTMTEEQVLQVCAVVARSMEFASA